MGNIWISLEKAVKSFFAAGGAVMVFELLNSFPKDQVIYGSITIGVAVGLWTGITNAYKHWGDPVQNNVQNA